MLPTKHRLSKSAAVVKTTARGRSFFNPTFLIKYLADKTITKPLFTVIVSNKVSGSAVVRNRLKRIVRHEFHQVLDKVKPGQYVFIIKKSAAAIPSVEFKEQIKSGIIQSKIIN